jgi:SAM-dependent methyltransferase
MNKKFAFINWVMGILGRNRFCPVCGKYSIKFNKFGRVPRENAMCPHCGALERHRFVWSFFNLKTDLFDGRPKKMLHIAPEPCLEHILKNCLGDNYITADLQNQHVMVQMDIMDIQYPDAYFDVIYCSHVLEHVPDDRRAMREFYRVLNPNGWAVLLVPLYHSLGKTLEDPSIVDPDERLRMFSQSDHVRKYGPDFVDRLNNAGFDVATIGLYDLLVEADIVRFGLGGDRHSNEIFLCTKGH